ncbi:MAG: tRNA (adenosine(37)-N6)-threonylcarbamoyltransferase complex dimerization subunit type 1 TsaB [Acidobacteria bacterium]|nr:tRNA (adenosine(37)-N6)-threonylcarbamoyltransferase complex dimerization subunit type 1 TsaB [Acidobacteriota bacterium]
MTETNINKTEPLILAIDTSSPRASMALSRGSQLIAELGIIGNERRSTNLLNEIDWLLTRLDLAITDITAFSVLIGPGSFTGLRVGLATIKGFAHSLNLPVIAMKSTEVIARACGVSEATCVILDAHREEVFLQLFSSDDSGEVRELSEINIAKLEQALALVYEYQQSENLPRIVFAGDALELYKEKILKFAVDNGIFIPKAKLLTTNRLGWILNKQITFLAPEMALYAQEKFSLNQVLNASEVSAYYVRPAEAEVKLKLGLIGKKKNNLS